MSQFNTAKQAGDGTVSDRVIARVAAERGEEPLELPPLYDVIDPDALDKLFDSGIVRGKNGPGYVVFTLANCEVVVHSSGVVDVSAPDEGASASIRADGQRAGDDV